MTRLLITGASGFIGKAVLDVLPARGLEIHALSRTKPNGLPSNCVWHAGDLLDRREMLGIVSAVRAEYLLHLGWYAEPGAFWTSAENLEWVGATLSLVKAFTEAGGRRAVFAGSCAEYDWSFDRYDEQTTPLVPATLYGVAKDATRRVVERYAKQVGLSFAWGRVFFLYGPHEDPRRLVSSVTLGLLRGERTPTTSGTQVRDFMHVADVADGLVTLLLSEVCGAVNIASGESVPLLAVVQEIAGLLSGSDLLDVGSLPTRPNEPPSLVAEVRRLREEVGFVPARTLKSGLAETVEWWKKQQPVQG